MDQYAFQNLLRQELQRMLRIEEATDGQVLTRRDTDEVRMAFETATGGPPSPHAATHQDGGGDEIATTTPAAGAIPKAGVGGTLAASWVPTFDSANDGIVPASGGGTTNFLRADGTWAAPSGGGSGVELFAARKIVSLRI